MLRESRAAGEKDSKTSRDDPGTERDNPRTCPGTEPARCRSSGYTCSAVSSAHHLSSVHHAALGLVQFAKSCEKRHCSTFVFI